MGAPVSLGACSSGGKSDLISILILLPVGAHCLKPNLGVCANWRNTDCSEILMQRFSNL